MSAPPPAASQIDWDDFRFFEALARSGSVRGAAAELGTSHSTLSRHMDALETRLQVQLFDRGPRGFTLTEAGETLAASAREALAVIHAGQRRVAGLDRRMTGPLRATMPDFLAYYVLLPAIRRYQEDFPDVGLEIDVSYAAHDLDLREADVAVRMLHIGETPPLHLVGRKVGTSYATAYGARDYLARHDLSCPQGGAAWLGWDPKGGADWLTKTAYPHLPLRGIYNSGELQRHAAAAGLGLAYIPCIIGESDPRLLRVPKMNPLPARDIWVLTHEDLRSSKRMRVFRDRMVAAIRANEVRLTGSAVQASGDSQG